MNSAATTPPSTTPTPEERLEAMEFLVGQLILNLEAEQAAVRAQLDRIEYGLRMVSEEAPGRPTEEEDVQPFTADSFGAWMQTCLERMRAHQSVTARQMVAIGQLTDRVLSFGEHLAPEPEPGIGSTAQSALDRARRPLPPG